MPALDMSEGAPKCERLSGRADAFKQSKQEIRISLHHGVKLAYVPIQWIKAMFFDGALSHNSKLVIGSIIQNAEQHDIR
jgi:hypothetical protein